MVRQISSVIALTGNASLGSGTNVLEVYDVPTNPTKGIMHAKLVKVVIANRTGANGEVYIDDNETSGTALGSVPLIPTIMMASGDTLLLNEDDFGEVFLKTGIIAGASNAATSSGYHIQVEVEVMP